MNTSHGEADEERNKQKKRTALRLINSEPFILIDEDASFIDRVLNLWHLNHIKIKRNYNPFKLMFERVCQQVCVYILYVIVSNFTVVKLFTGSIKFGFI